MPCIFDHHQKLLNHLVVNIYILHLHMVVTFTYNLIIFDNAGSKFLKIYPIFGNFFKLFEKYELEQRYRGILFYSFQYIVT